MTEHDPDGVWRITLGELDEKMGVRILEESIHNGLFAGEGVAAGGAVGASVSG